MLKAPSIAVLALLSLCSLCLSACGSQEKPGSTQSPFANSPLGNGLTPINASPSPLVGELSAGDAYDNPGYGEDVSTPQGPTPTTQTRPSKPETLPAATPAPVNPATAGPQAGQLAIGELPNNLEVLAPFNPGTGGQGGYLEEARFQTDQDTFNQWQAVNLVSDGNALFVAAVDLKSPSKGTVIQMDSSGANWKDIGKSLLATITLGAAGYKMSASLQALTFDDRGNLLVAEASQKLFRLSAPKFELSSSSLSFSEALDLAYAGGSYYLATASGLFKLGADLAALSPFGTAKPTGGLATDTQGQLYAVVGNSIHKFDAAGTSGEIVTGLSAPIDLAVDAEGNLFVLESSGVRWFNANGESKGEFASGDLSSPKAIAIDLTGNIYIADAGKDHTDSVVIKYVKG